MDAMGLEVGTKQQLALATVMALPTQFGIVGCYVLTDLQTGCHFRAQLDNHARCFVASDNWHTGHEIAIVDVQVRATNAARFN